MDSGLKLTMAFTIADFSIFLLYIANPEPQQTIKNYDWHISNVFELVAG